MLSLSIIKMGSDSQKDSVLSPKDIYPCSNFLQKSRTAFDDSSESFIRKKSYDCRLATVELTVTLGLLAWVECS